jgi:Flp pilus assembly secretin CpaC
MALKLLGRFHIKARDKSLLGIRISLRVRLARQTSSSASMESELASPSAAEKSGETTSFLVNRHAEAAVPEVLRRLRIHKGRGP